MRANVAVVAVFAGGLAVGSVRALGGVDATLDMPVLSAYVWRGQVLNDEAVIQPSLTLTKGGLSLNIWASFNLTDRLGEDCRSDFSEVDLTATYAGTVGPVGYTVGIAEYLFPHQIIASEDGNRPYPGTRELFLTLGLPGVLMSPVLSVYYDADEIDGAYAALSVSHKTSLGESLALTLSASVGYGLSAFNEGYFGVDEAALNDGVVGLALTWSPSATVSVTPAVQYVALLDDQLRDAGVYFDDHATVGSLKVSIVF
jgi:hypothetical protein